MQIYARFIEVARARLSPARVFAFGIFLRSPRTDRSIAPFIDDTQTRDARYTSLIARATRRNIDDLFARHFARRKT